MEHPGSEENKSTQEDSTDEVEVPVNQEKEKTETLAEKEEEPLEKVVYLTFDDGPSLLTDQFLDVLDEHGVKATFFMQGSNLKKEHL
ncbi:polysaccharide deacetylase family protein, partial [Microvirga sp. 3-52]|nr:polysaccharide deacetylase family protein [Microvirga sp. 3-52]